MLEDRQGNFLKKNARFRKAVCERLHLQWRSVSGPGNCFFKMSACCFAQMLRNPISFVSMWSTYPAAT